MFRDRKGEGFGPSSASTLIFRGLGDPPLRGQSAGLAFRRLIGNVLDWARFRGSPLGKIEAMFPGHRPRLRGRKAFAEQSNGPRIDRPRVFFLIPSGVAPPGRIRRRSFVPCTKSFSPDKNARMSHTIKTISG